MFKAHEVFIQCEESSSVITWDFDVMRQDINFNVLRLLIEIQPATLLNCARGINKSINYDIITHMYFICFIVQLLLLF